MRTSAPTSAPSCWPWAAPPRDGRRSRTPWRSVPTASPRVSRPASVAASRRLRGGRGASPRRAQGGDRTAAATPPPPGCCSSRPARRARSSIPHHARLPAWMSRLGPRVVPGRRSGDAPAGSRGGAGGAAGGDPGAQRLIRAAPMRAAHRLQTPVPGARRSHRMIRKPRLGVPARLPRVAGVILVGLFVLVAFAACSAADTASSSGDAAGLTTSSGQNLVGIAPGTITSNDYSAAKVARALRHQARRHGRPEPPGHQLRVAAGDRLPGHVHAGGLRAGRDGLHPGQERAPHDEHELHDLRDRDRGVLPGGLRLRLRRPRHRGRLAARWAEAARRR